MENVDCGGAIPGLPAEAGLGYATANLASVMEAQGVIGGMMGGGMMGGGMMGGMGGGF